MFDMLIESGLIGGRVAQFPPLLVRSVYMICARSLFCKLLGEGKYSAIEVVVCSVFQSSHFNAIATSMLSPFQCYRLLPS